MLLSAWRLNLLKSEIRELVRPLRRLITPDYRQKAGLAAAGHFTESSFFRDYQHFACYLALPEEIDTLPLMQALWKAGKACYLPLVSSPEEKKLSFALYEEGMPLEMNRYRVLEPIGSSRVVSASELEVVLLPLLAFDGKGNRLGSGGGYYDRTFEFTLQPGFTRENKPRLLGLAYELQRVEAISSEQFDVPLEAVVTEGGVTVFQTK
jgi:5-formyltetrahydrofolate cyclo-ligase